jgi:hypothetical protein
MGRIAYEITHASRTSHVFNFMQKLYPCIFQVVASLYQSEAFLLLAPPIYTGTDCSRP